MRPPRIRLTDTVAHCQPEPGAALPQFRRANGLKHPAQALRRNTAPVVTHREHHRFTIRSRLRAQAPPRRSLGRPASPCTSALLTRSITTCPKGPGKTLQHHVRRHRQFNLRFLAFEAGFERLDHLTHRLVQVEAAAALWTPGPPATCLKLRISSTGPLQRFVSERGAVVHVLHELQRRSY